MASEGFAKPWAEFEEEFGERPLLPYDSVEECLEGFGKIGAKMASQYTFPAPDPAVNTEDKTIDGGLKIRVYTPEGYSGGKPVGVYYHGGGWAMSDIDGDDAFCRSISKGGNVVLVSVEYGLAPQNKHPGLINDCFAGLQWTLKNAKALGGIEGKIFTAGVSAGGQLAIALALKALDEGLGDSLVGVVAQVPATIHPDGIPEELKSRYTSYEEHASHTIDTDRAMRAFWRAFGTPPTDTYGSPLLHPKIKNLNKVYLTVAGHDTLRDDGLLFKEKLEENKVSYKFNFYEGYPHYHWTWPSSKLDKPREEYNANLAKGVQWVVS
ncbi:alpha/beta-hydrolase [Karstenula rhodostoma CBS 690.94]|uniref:Alpha/beta-hydrolase n=1 Tax=Karstenula rhodostoma CBS 690.94 TaxID=1392251 RepID=A0A9P4P9W8_9PLEO|nr:alpha/beta-hydrolase [Karstenula rhodostoma CBS 690.94]